MKKILYSPSQLPHSPSSPPGSSIYSHPTTHLVLSIASNLPFTPTNPPHSQRRVKLPQHNSSWRSSVRSGRWFYNIDVKRQVFGWAKGDLLGNQTPQRSKPTSLHQRHLVTLHLQILSHAWHFAFKFWNFFASCFELAHCLRTILKSYLLYNPPNNLRTPLQ